MHFETQYGALLAPNVSERFNRLAHLSQIVIHSKGAYQPVSLPRNYMCLCVVEGHSSDLFL
jgi:hypothetical protein